jgi:hypothetical protein
MKRFDCFVVSIIAAIVFCFGVQAVKAEDEPEISLDKSLKGIKFGVLAYVDYSSGQAPEPDGEEENYNQFALTRGYLTVKKSLTDWMSMRLTTDIKQEYKAPGAKLDGSYVVRMKYYYAEFKPSDLEPFTDMKSEVGMGHMPWLDFEEHINPYRCQGTMAIERPHIFNSADLGVSLRGYFGGRLEGAEEKTGSHYYDGKYGSWHAGIYNGGGYHDVENNENKVAEGRITLRPLPDILPGLQLSYLGISGEGNVEEGAVVMGMIMDDIPKFEVNLGMVSYEHPWVTVTGQMFTTRGNQSGEWVNPDGEALETEGWSAFANVKIPGTDKKANIFGRHDFFDIDPGDEWTEDTAYAMTIGGVAFDIYKHNLLLFVWESTDYEDDADEKGHMSVEDIDLGNEDKYQVVLQIKF